nr:uncharacterized protein LOC108065640 [Drosophila takahashii]
MGREQGTSATLSCLLTHTHNRVPRERHTNRSRSDDQLLLYGIAVHLGSNDTTYASRGRRTAGSGEPPDDTYNDGVRRIRSAHSCEQLRYLVHRIQWRSNCSDEVPVALALGSQTSESGRLSKKININKCLVESPQQQLPLDFYSYLQLANGYYERGLQANIKYLQSIGQRGHNAIRPSSGLFLDVVQRDESPVQKLSVRLVTLLENLRRKAAKEQGGDPGIWVNIRSVKREGQEKKESTKKELEEEPTKQLDSMCDYYAPDCTTTEISGPTGTSAGGVTLAKSLATSTSEAALLQATITSPEQRRLYEIIDNLSHLSLGDSSRRRQQLTLSLPQITLTDCTAQQVALHSATFDIVTLQIPDEARPPNLKKKTT